MPRKRASLLAAHILNTLESLFPYSIGFASAFNVELALASTFYKWEKTWIHFQARTGQKSALLKLSIMTVLHETMEKIL